MFYAKMAAVFFTIILLIHFNWPLWGAVLIASLPYLLKDGVSVVAAYGAARAILFSLKKAKLGNAL